jgi:hypothetical protein
MACYMLWAGEGRLTYWTFVIASHCGDGEQRVNCEGGTAEVTGPGGASLNTAEVEEETGDGERSKHIYIPFSPFSLFSFYTHCIITL